MIREVKQEEFEEIVKEGFHIVDFYGTTCMPCKQLAKVLEEIDKEVPQLSIIKINIDENRDVVSKFDIMSVPTILFYKDGIIIERKIGLMPKMEIFSLIGENMY